MKKYKNLEDCNPLRHSVTKILLLDHGVPDYTNDTEEQRGLFSNKTTNDDSQ